MRYILKLTSLLLIGFLSNYNAIAQSIKTTWSEEQKLTTWEAKANIVHIDKDGVYLLEEAFSKNRSLGFVGFAHPVLIYKLHKFDNSLTASYNKEIKKQDDDDDYINFTFKNSLYIATNSYNKKSKTNKFFAAKLSPSGEVGKWTEIATASAFTKEEVEFNVGYNSDSSRVFLAYLEKTDKGERLYLTNFDENLSVTNAWKASTLSPLGTFDITSLTQTPDNNIIVAGKEYKFVAKKKGNEAFSSAIKEGTFYEKLFYEGQRKFVRCSLKCFDKDGTLLSIKGLDNQLENALNVSIVPVANGYILSGLTTSNKDSLTINGAYFISLSNNASSIISAKTFPIDSKIFEKVTKESRKVTPAEIVYNKSDSSIYLFAEEVQWSGRQKQTSAYREPEKSIYELNYMNGDLFVLKKNLFTENLDINKISKAQLTTRTFFYESRVPEEFVTFFHPDWSSTFRSSYYVFPGSKGVRIIYNDNSNSRGYNKSTLTSEDFETMRNADCYYASVFNNKPAKKIILKNADGFIANPQYRTGNTLYFVAEYTHSLGKDEIKLAKMVIGED